ncbi:transposase, partial [Patescibacteria group bacterium]|nr:transposase [Patescibacteria group bacterium]
LTNLANLMEKYKKELFTCVVCKGVAPTNNKAEQKLRHLVLKRKNSFGTKSEKGNKVLSINLSVILSTWWQNKNNFFQKFNGLLTQCCSEKNKIEAEPVCR